MNDPIKVAVPSMNAKLDGVVDLDPKARLEWPPFPSSRSKESNGLKTNLVVCLSVDTKTQMVEENGEGHIDGHFEDLPQKIGIMSNPLGSK